MSPPKVDDRIWRPDLLAVLDWEAVYKSREERFGDLATWWVSGTPGVNYYRASIPAKHLPGRTISFETTDLQPDGYGGHCFPRQSGAAIWLFPGNRLRHLLMAEMKNQGMKVMVEVDDNYTIGPPVPSISEWKPMYKMPGGYHASYEVHCQIVGSKAVDGVICSTPQLGRVYERFGKPVHVCRNSIDVDDWTDDPPHQADDILRIGWAGSASHFYDLADIQRALDWASRQPNVEVVILGELTLPIKHRNIPWTTSLAEYRENVCEIDVMLCPLRENSWSSCKSDVKAMEAAMAGACSIVSKTEPYRPWWDGEAPGYVAETRKDWLKAVKHVVAKREETRETARLARSYVLAERRIETEITRWRQAIS